MEGNKEYHVVYHLGGGIEAVEIVLANTEKEAACNIDAEGVKEFIGENDKFFKFKMEDVKMISVKEQKNTINS